MEDEEFMNKKEILHDIRNPLGVISTYAQLLSNADYHQMLDREKILDIAGEIQTAVQSIQSILEAELSD